LTNWPLREGKEGVFHGEFGVVLKVDRAFCKIVVFSKEASMKIVWSLPVAILAPVWVFAMPEFKEGRYICVTNPAQKNPSSDVVVLNRVQMLGVDVVHSKSESAEGDGKLIAVCDNTRAEFRNSDGDIIQKSVSCEGNRMTTTTVLR